MNHYEELFHDIQRDERYLRNLSWGEPRPGHPEGTVKAHIDELERNLASLTLNPDGYWKLRVLIHVHDSFKAEADRKAAITDPKSHASIAASFLREHGGEADLVNMVQFHDEPYALWRQWRERGACNEARLLKLTSNISDWALFIKFCVIDGVTAGKSSEPLDWMVEHIARRVGLQPLASDTIAQVASALPDRPGGVKHKCEV